jgi:hypothetical protein
LESAAGNRRTFNKLCDPSGSADRTVRPHLGGGAGMEPILAQARDACGIAEGHLTRHEDGRNARSGLHNVSYATLANYVAMVTYGLDSSRFASPADVSLLRRPRTRRWRTDHMSLQQGPQPTVVELTKAEPSRTFYASQRTERCGGISLSDRYQGASQSTAKCLPAKPTEGLENLKRSLRTGQRKASELTLRGFDVGQPPVALGERLSGAECQTSIREASRSGARGGERLA